MLTSLHEKKNESNGVKRNNNKIDVFLICFPMKSILSLVVTSEITIFIFTVSKNGLFMNSGLNVLPKCLQCSILV